MVPQHQIKKKERSSKGEFTMTNKEKTIQNHMAKLQITREEAIELYNFDKNPTEELKEKRSPLEKVKFQKPKKAPVSETRENLLTAISNLITQDSTLSIKSTDNTSIIIQAPNEEIYTIKISKKRA